MASNLVVAASLWRTIPELCSDLRTSSSPQDRLAVLRRAGERFHLRFMDEPVLPWAASVALARVPYPAWYAFSGVRAQQILSGGMIHLMARVGGIPIR